MKINQKIKDIVSGAFIKSPTDIEQAFDSAMSTKILDVIDVKRAEMGVNFSTPANSNKNTD